MHSWKLFELLALPEKRADFSELQESRKAQVLPRSSFQKINEISHLHIVKFQFPSMPHDFGWHSAPAHSPHCVCQTSDTLVSSLFWLPLPTFWSWCVFQPRHVSMCAMLNRLWLCVTSLPFAASKSMTWQSRTECCTVYHHPQSEAQSYCLFTTFNMYFLKLFWLSVEMHHLYELKVNICGFVLLNPSWCWVSTIPLISSSCMQSCGQIFLHWRKFSFL